MAAEPLARAGTEDEAENAFAPPPADPDALPYDSLIPVLLLQAREAMMRNFRPLVAAEGFTEQQWRALRALAAHGPMDAAALSERSVILPPSLTRILRHLEERGLIERRRDAGDRRRTLCALSAEGWRIVEDLAHRTAAVHAEIERRFGPARAAELKRLLRDIAALD